MEAVVKDYSVFDKLDMDEYMLVASYASSLIRNRHSENSEASCKFQEIREKMLKKNPMSDEEIDRQAHY